MVVAKLRRKYLSAKSLKCNAKNIQSSVRRKAIDKRRLLQVKEKIKMGKKCINSTIGGQAVIEGVMMRGKKSMATAVRDESGKIVIESAYIKQTKDKTFWYRTPFLRGIFNFGSTLVVGMKTLLRSGEVFEGEVEPSKFETWCAKKLKINVFSVMMGFAVFMGIALAIGLFFFLPQLAASGIDKLFGLYGINIESIGAKIGMNLIEGVIRIIIFVIYIALTCLMKDVKRTYMYHGAEHKTISCYERELELTVENARKMSTVHDRCGTTFMFIIMVVSVLIFSFTGWFGNVWIRFAIRLALLPVVAGISYEILKFLARFDNWFVKILKAPGLWLQKLTTKEPTDDMLEVAIAAFSTVMKMDADSTVPVQFFDTKIQYKKAREQVEEIVKTANAEKSDVDWIFCEACGVKRDELEKLTSIKMSKFIAAKDFAKLRAEGKPLWQVFGKANFYGYNIQISDKVLCPRNDTEFVCEAAIALVNSDSKVLDMCCGSGCIAIAIAGEKGAEVVAADISDDALNQAKENIKLNNLETLVSTQKTDMFKNIQGKFDVIICNPPYIKTADILSLDAEVKNCEPHLALDGGDDGYDFYRIIAKDAKKFLKENGALVLELGIEQAEYVKNLFEDNYDVEIKKDLQGVDRIFVGKIK